MWSRDGRTFQLGHMRGPHLSADDEDEELVGFPTRPVNPRRSSVYLLYFIVPGILLMMLATSILVHDRHNTHHVHQVIHPTDYHHQERYSSPTSDPQTSAHYFNHPPNVNEVAPPAHPLQHGNHLTSTERQRHDMSSPTTGVHFLRFLMIGDWGEPNAQQKRVADAMASVAARREASFVVSVGDNFYETGVLTATDRQWKHTFEDTYHHPALQIHWWVVAGNHDYRGNPYAQIEYTQISHRWKMPALNYTNTWPLYRGAAVHKRADHSLSASKAFEHTRGVQLGVKTKIISESVKIIFMDTLPLAKLDNRVSHATILDFEPKPELEAKCNAQLAWVEQELVASIDKYVLVVGHHPVFSGGPHGKLGILETKLKPLLERYNVSAYVSGHDHNLQHLETNGVAYIITGSGARLSETHPVEGLTKWAEKEPGFVCTEAKPDRLEMDFYSDSGRVLHTAVLLPRTL